MALRTLYIYKVIGLLCSGYLFCQPDFSFKNILVHDGLSESTVKVIYEDRKGLIYLGTENGLDIFDGYGFVNYHMKSFDNSSLLGNQVSSIFEDSENKIWVGTELGVSRFNPSKREFDRPFNSATAEGHVIISPEIIVEDANGSLWILSGKGGKNHVFKTLPENNDLVCQTCRSDLFNNNSIYNLFMDEDRGIWIGADYGLFYPDSETGDIQEFKTGNGENIGRVEVIEQGEQGTLWVGTSNGLYKINKKFNNVEEHYKLTIGKNSIVSNTIVDLDWDKVRKELWIATRDGISRFKPESNHFINYQETPYAESIIENDISKILIAEKSGNLWFTTKNNRGINCLYESPNIYHGGLDTLFNHFSHDPIDKNSLTDNTVECFIEDKAGHVWIGTNQNGISFHSYVQSKFHSIQFDRENEWGLKNEKIYSIATQESGMIWASTGFGLEYLSVDGIRDYEYEKSFLGNIDHILDVEVIDDEIIWVATDDGIIRINTMTDDLIRFSNDQSLPATQQIPENRVFDLMVSNDEYIWAGTATGLLIIDGFAMETKFFNSDLIIRILFQDNNGNVWVGSEREGIYFLDKDLVKDIYNEDNFEVEGHVFDPSLSGGISSSQITCITEDKNGAVWIGTVGGLNKYLHRDETFSHYFMEDGLPSNYITALAIDLDNNLWISSKKGLTYFDQKDTTFVNYSLMDGIGNLDYHRNCYDSDELGNLYFGGPNGITKVNSSGIQYNEYQPPCIITRVKKTSFDDEIIEVFDISAKKSQVEGNIEIDHGIKSFTIDFVALNYYNTIKNQYRYKLAPLDKDWIYSGDLRFATYNNLGRGEYQFMVQGSNNDGLWSKPEILSIKFIPHPLLSYWAFSIYFLLVSIGIYIFIKFRMQKQKNELEEERRMKELEQAREFQMSLIPQSPPEHPDYEFAFHMKTSTEVGGDYYDFFPQKDGSLYVVVGDATGHGLNAGMMVSITKAGLVSTAVKSPAEITQSLNRVIKTIDLGTNRMSLNMTKIENGTFEFTSAGMPPGYIYRSQESSVEEILVPGLPLGSMKLAEFDHQKFDMKPGDAFVLISDGLPECVNPKGDMLDYDSIKKCTQENGHKSAQGIIDSLIELGNSWMSGLMNDDDITLVVIKRKEL